MCPLLTLLNVALQVLQALVKETLLVVGDLADRVNLLNTVGSESDFRREVGDAVRLLEERGVDVGWLNDALLALSSLEEGLGETGTSHGHGEGSGSGAILGLDNLVTTKLHALDVVVALLALELVSGLAEEWDNGLTRVATDDSDVLVGGVGILDLGDEARGTDNVEGGHTEELLGVVDALALEDLGSDGDRAVDGVGDDEHVGIWRVLCGGLGEVADDRGVGVEEVYRSISQRHTVSNTALILTITGHAWLAWNTSWDDNDLSALQSGSETLLAWLISSDL